MAGQDSEEVLKPDPALGFDKQMEVVALNGVLINFHLKLARVLLE
jgi:hypothetical protein